MTLLVLIDGTNVWRSAAWSALHPGVGEAELARRFLDRCVSWVAAEGAEAFVAFDGTPPGPGSDRCEVVGSGPDDADALLERAGAQARAARRRHWVVSSDRAVTTVAGQGAERVLDVQTFATLLHDSPGRASGAGPAEAAASRVGDHLDAATRSSLERLRRGED